MDNLITSLVEVKAEKQQNLLSVKFLTFVPYQEFLKIAEHEYELIRRYQFKKCMIDLRLIPVYAEGMPEYVRDVWFPTVKSLGMQHIAFVVPEAVLGQMSMNRAHKVKDENAGMDVEHFKDIKDAKAWLKSC